MSADDHLSPQFFHGSPAQFNPGDELTREGAWRAKYPSAAERLDKGRSSTGYYPEGWKYGTKTNDDNHPVEDHLYYGDRSLLDSGESKSYGGHVYAVEPLTPAGKPSKSHRPDPNYTSEGMTGAYRTKGKLRVIHEVDSNGDPV
jgi:hypothetical protein